MQKEKIRRLEHHAAQLEDSLKTRGIISPSVVNNSIERDGDEGGGQTVQAQSREADGELP